MLNNFYFKNAADIGGVIDIDFQSGLVLFLQEFFSENFGYQISQNKIGSASIGSLRTSNNASFFMINIIAALNWCEAKGKNYYM